jgi:hypothetical protein
MLAARNLSQTIAERAQSESGQAELHEWIGSTYGHNLNDAPADADGVALALAALDGEPPDVKIVTRQPRKGVKPLVFIAVAVAAFAIVEWRFTAIRSALFAHQPPEQSTEQVDVAAPVETVAVPAVEQPEAPSAAEIKADQLASEAAALKLARDTAENAASAASAQLDAERVARAKAEDAALTARKELAAKEELAARELAAKELAAKEEQARKATRIEPAPAPAAAAPVPAEPAPPSATPAIEASTNKTVPVQLIKTSIAPEVRKSDILTGQALLAEGKLAAARQSFEKAVKLGMPEGALALGNTYDPASLAKLGIKEKGNPELARQWYRRAHEIALQKR